MLLLPNAVRTMLLHHEHLFVGAARRRDAADRTGAVALLDVAQPVGGVRDRLVPRHDSPLVVDRLAHHRLEHTVVVRGVAPGEATLHARVTLVGATVLVRHHAHHLLALHLGLERAADAAVGAGGDDRPARLTHLDDRLLGERRRGAHLHAGAARHAVGLEERAAGAGGDTRAEAATLDGERERALDVFAGPHATRADDALRRIEREVRVGLVLGELEVVVAGVAVAHVAQADLTGRVLQLAVAVGRAGEAVERVVGDVQLHHAAAQPLEAAATGW